VPELDCDHFKKEQTMPSDRSSISQVFCALAVLAALLVGLPADRCVARSPAEQLEPFFEMQQVYEGQRFPSVVVALDGTVLAFRAAASPVQVRRSEDGGATWGPIIEVGGDRSNLGAAIVDERSGDIMVFQGRNLFRSRDTGKTWQPQEAPVEPDGFGGTGNTHGADSGITLRFGKHQGRLLQPARVIPPGMDNDPRWWPYHYNSAIYSDDGGASWKTSHPFPVLGTGEGTLAELSDGRVYYNSRCHLASDALRRIAWSHDGGVTWINPERCDTLPDGVRGSSYGCAGGLTRLPADDADILVYSNLDFEGGHGRGSGRQKITVWASLDGARTWPVKRLVYDGPSAYSSLAAGRPGTPSEGLVYLLFEGGPDGMYSGIHLARFNLAWITAGEKTGTR
jgi:sialidase-1